MTGKALKRYWRNRRREERREARRRKFFNYSDRRKRFSLRYRIWKFFDDRRFKKKMGEYGKQWARHNGFDIR